MNHKEMIKAMNTVFDITKGGALKGEIHFLVAKNRVGKTQMIRRDPNLISYYLPFEEGTK